MKTYYLFPEHQPMPLKPLQERQILFAPRPEAEINETANIKTMQNINSVFIRSRLK